jgi:hypothetical protein
MRLSVLLFDVVIVAGRTDDAAASVDNIAA